MTIPTYHPIETERILAVDPLPRGFAFAVLEEDPFRLVDWGVATTPRKEPLGMLASLDRVIRRYDPSVLVTEEPQSARLLRRAALSAFLESAAEIVLAGSFPIATYSRRAIREAFAPMGARTKLEIARVIAERFPELRSRLPRPRRIWESEDARMSVFDAVSLAITHLAAAGSRLPRDG